MMRLEVKAKFPRSNGAEFPEKNPRASLIKNNFECETAITNLFALVIRLIIPMNVRISRHDNERKESNVIDTKHVAL